MEHGEHCGAFVDSWDCSLRREKKLWMRGKGAGKCWQERHPRGDHRRGRGHHLSWMEVQALCVEKQERVQECRGCGQTQVGGRTDLSSSCYSDE